MDLFGQFKIYHYIPISIFGYKLDFTNSGLSMLIALIIIMIIVIARSRGYIIGILDIYSDFIKNLVIQNAGRGAVFAIPFISSIFLFILLSNLLGLIPNMFTSTSHFTVNLTISLCAILYIIYNGLSLHGLRFLQVFCPSGIPLFIKPLMIVIEIFSFCIRPISLAIRLTANMFVGHVVMKVLLYVSIELGKFGCLLWPVYIAILFFEFCIALLHAYIFTFLTCIYLKDAIESHH